MQRFGYMGERRAEKPKRDDEATHTPIAAESNHDCQACRTRRKGARSPCLGLLEGRVCLEPAPGPSGRVWTERQGSSGRRSHTGAWPQLGWPRRLGGVREEQPDFSPRQTFSPHLWLPLVEPTQEQSRRQPGNRKTHSYRREEESGTEDDEPPAHQRPDCTLLFAAAGQRGAGATQREAWGSGHSAGPLGYGLMGPNRNVRPNAGLSLSAPRFALFFFKRHHIMSSIDGWKKYK